MINKNVEVDGPTSIRANTKKKQFIFRSLYVHYIILVQTTVFAKVVVLEAFGNSPGCVNWTDLGSLQRPCKARCRKHDHPFPRIRGRALVPSLTEESHGMGLGASWEMLVHVKSRISKSVYERPGLELSSLPTRHRCPSI